MSKDDDIEKSHDPEAGKQAETAPQAEPDGPAKAVRKLVITLALLGAAWLVFTIIMPRLTLPEAAQPTARTERADSSKQQANAPAREKVGDIVSFAQRLEALEQEVQQLKDRPQATDDMAGQEAMKQFIEGVKQQREEANAASEQRIAELESSLEEQKRLHGQVKQALEAMQAKTGNHIAALTAYAHLREAVLRAEPFDYQLSQLKKLTENLAELQQPIATLSTMAAVGAPEHSTLVRGFEHAAERALSPDTKPGSVLANVKSLVRIRKTGTPEGDDSEAIIARAENALSKKRVAAAIEILKDLPPAASKAFSDWHKEAQQYMDSRSALDTLEVALVQKKTAEASASTPAPAMVQKPSNKAEALKEDEAALAPPPATEVETNTPASNEAENTSSEAEQTSIEEAFEALKQSDPTEIKPPADTPSDD